MSEYVSKQKFLEWINNELLAWQSPDEEDIRWTYEYIREKIQSGIFDADEYPTPDAYEAACKALWKHREETQHLRAALEKAKQYVMNGYELGYIDDREGYTEALVREIDKPLSTTHESTGAERVIGLRAWDKELEMFHDEVVAIDFRLRKIRVFSRSEDDYPSDWLPLERFVLYGINAPKGEGNDA